MWVNLLAATLLAVPPPLAGHAQACGPSVTQPLAEAPWAQARMRADLAWPLSTGAGITVAIIDSGVSDNHPALSGKVNPGQDFVAPGKGDCDENGHGTLIAGIIAGRENASNGFVFQGVAPGARVVPVKVLRDQSRSLDKEAPARIASAVRWAVDNGKAQVINMSLSTTDDPQLASAITYALGKGVVVVAAAGNERAPDQPSYPAAYEGVIAVAATDKDDKHSGTSTAGAYVDIAAPGTRIAGPSPAGGGYLFSEQGGTSFASAYVTGVVALLRAYEPALNPAQVAKRLTETADHPAEIWNPQVGFGIVNAQRAVGALQAQRPPSAVAARVEPVPTPPDPLREATFIASIAAVAGLALIVALLAGLAAWRRGRSRNWRPSRTPDPSG